jgi:hypothetical protein
MAQEELIHRKAQTKLSQNTVPLSMTSVHLLKAGHLLNTAGKLVHSKDPPDGNCLKEKYTV